MMMRWIHEVLRFSRLHWFLPLLLVVLYLGPAFVGLEKFPGPESTRVLEILLVSLGLYVVLMKLLGPTNALQQLVNNRSRIYISESILKRAIMGLFVVVSLVAMATTPQVALLEAFRGASSQDLEYFRELMFKAREGPELVLGYLNAMLSVTLVPYVICLAYWNGSRDRHLVLAIFVILLLPSLEKALILRALVPLVFLFANMKRFENLPPLRVAGLFVLGVTVIYLLTSITVASETAELPQDNSPYAVLDISDPFQYVLNRIFWIPYVTAYDYIRYLDQQLQGDFLMGKSIGALAFLFNFDKLNIEREVFEFQWGQNEAGTGSANTAFFIDAFMNFGWAGVIIYTLLVVLIVRAFMASDNAPAKAVFAYHCLFLASSSLSGTLFSGGLLLLILMLVFVRTTPLVESRANGEVKAKAAPPPKPEIRPKPLALVLPHSANDDQSAAPLPELIMDIPEPRSRAAREPIVTGSIVLYKHTRAEIGPVIQSILLDLRMEMLYLMDNGDSPDEYKPFLGKRVTYVNMDGNVGFGKAHNAAMGRALELGAKYHIVINPDVKVRDGAISTLFAAMERDPQIGLISPQLLNPNGTIQYLCKLLPTPYDLAVRRFGTEGMRRRNDMRFTVRESGYDKPMEVPSLPGAFMFMRMDVLRELGGFDEDYFMYLEDLDMCRRIGRLRKTVFYPDAEVIHAHGRGSYHSLRLFAHHIRSVIRYFGTYGWFFDRERRVVNAAVLAGLQESYSPPPPIEPQPTPQPEDEREIAHGVSQA